MEQNNKIDNTDNTELEAVVKEFGKEQNKENLAKLMANMHVAQLYVPAIFPKDMDMSLINDVPQGEAIKIPAGVKLIPAIIRNPNGESFLPVFTSKEQIPEEPKYPAILVLPYVECRNMIDRSEGQLKAIAVNPFTDNLVLNPSFLEATKRAEAANAAPKQPVQVSVPQFNLMMRLQIERTILPAMLATNSDNAIEKLSANPEEFIFGLFDKAYEPGSVANPYRVEDFSSMVLDISEKLRYVAIHMPKKNLTIGTCHHIYIAIDPQTKRTGYYIAVQADNKRVALLEVKGPKAIVELGDAPVEGEEIRTIMEAFEQ